MRVTLACRDGWMHRGAYIIANALVSLDDERRDAKIRQSCCYFESTVTSANDEDRWVTIIKVYFASPSALPVFVV